MSLKGGQNNAPADHVYVGPGLALWTLAFAFACHRHCRKLSRRTLEHIAACPTQMVTAWVFCGRKIKLNTDTAGIKPNQHPNSA